MSMSLEPVGQQVTARHLPEARGVSALPPQVEFIMFGCTEPDGMVRIVASRKVASVEIRYIWPDADSRQLGSLCGLRFMEPRMRLTAEIEEQVTAFADSYGAAFAVVARIWGGR